MAGHTLFTREPFTDTDGKRKLRWKTGTLFRKDATTGAMIDTGYVVDEHGAVRHGRKMFKGSKKDRKRFRAAAELALSTPVPEGFAELQPNDNITADCLVYDLAVGGWTPTPFHTCTTIQLNTRYPNILRAASRVKADQPSTPPDSSSTSTAPKSHSSEKTALAGRQAG